MDDLYLGCTEATFCSACCCRFDSNLSINNAEYWFYIQESWGGTRIRLVITKTHPVGKLIERYVKREKPVDRFLLFEELVHHTPKGTVAKLLRMYITASITEAKEDGAASARSTMREALGL